MIDKVKKNLTSGITRFKWIAEYVAGRTKAETSVARLLFESSKLEARMDELYRDVGKRVMELKEKGEESVLKDFVIQQALDELKNLKEEVDDYKSQAKTINKLPE